MDGELVVRGDKCSREYYVRGLLSSILDGPRRVSGQPERDTSLLVFKDSNFALFSSVEFGSGLPRVLALIGIPEVERLP